MTLDGEWKLFFRPERMDQDWREIVARVPGDAIDALWRAGVEGDPFYGENALDYRRTEFYEWRYEREFELPAEWAGRRLTLTLEGVNTIADVYINGIEVGCCANMLIAHEFDATAAAKPGERNLISVHIHSPINAVREGDFPASVSGAEHEDELTALRMPPHCFGWDIMPRLLSAGLWRSVSIAPVPATRITQAYYATLRADAESAELVFKYRFATDAPMLDGFSVRVSGPGFSLEQPALFVSGEGRLTINKPRLWWPRGYGEAELYNVTLEILRYGEVVASRADRIGLRKVELVRKMLPGDEGEFLINVNGVKIMAKGSNWVPLDALHSRDLSRVERAVGLLAEAGCNITRCWGGNVYESDRFYELCDANGIMVWQDFSFACAIYPQTDEFAREIAREAEAVIKRLRNHPSIILWAGDNEIDESYVGHGYEAEFNRYNAVSRETLPRAVRSHDPYRAYVPSSPYIPDGLPRYATPEQHNWGPRAYFKDDFYKHTTAHFISECGYHGCPSPASLKKYIPSEFLWPMNNAAWDVHNTDNLLNVRRAYNRNRLMADQVRLMFGFEPDNLQEFSLLSQVSQAEAKKFFIERARMLKWRRTGLIWWNMLDGWPQISDAVVDYYFDKKRAFGYIKRSQLPVCLMMDEQEGWSHRVVLGNDSRESFSVEYAVRDAATGETLLSGTAVSPANENLTLGWARLLPGAARLIILEWKIGGKRYANHYIAGFPPFDAETMKGWLKIIDALPEGDQ